MKILKTVTTQSNNPIELIGSEKSGNNILIIGVFHGDEPQGKFLIEEYLKKHSSSANAVQNNLLFIPCLNPDGLVQNTRTNANGVDLNRNFPTKNWGINQGENATCDDCTSSYYGGKSPASEVETQFVIDIINKYNPKAILTLHAPYKVVNYDGPAEELAQKISQIIKYPTESSIGYPTPGSFGTYCGIERNIPTITLELDEKIPTEQLILPAFKIFDLLKNLF